MKLHSSLTWLLLIEHLIVCNAWKSWIAKKNIIVIEMEQETDPVFPSDLNYTGYKYIELKTPKLNVLTTEMQSTISTMENFTALHGWINSVHLMAHFSSLKIYNCSTSEVVINPNRTYKMEHLSIVYGNLAKLPKHLNVLKNLEKLYLHDNKIEFVEMAEFNGLNKLKRLALQRNKVVEIRATLQNPAILPKLEIFSGHENRLVDVSFEHWNTTSLGEIWLRDNQLQIALSFPSAFPALKNVHIYNNPFNCQWLTSTMKELKARSNVTIYSESETSCDKNGPPHDELVRRVKLKETFATKPFRIWMTHLDAINQNVTANIELMQKQNVSLHNSYSEMQVKFGHLSANIENFQKEVKHKFMQITKESNTYEQQMNTSLKNLEISMKFEIHNITKATNSEGIKSINLLKIKDQELEAQIKAFLAKAEDLQTELKSLYLHQEQESAKLRQEMATLENERKADHQQFKQMFEELQHQMNASSIELEDTAYGGIFKLERYSAIFVIIGIFGFLYLFLIYGDYSKTPKSNRRERNFQEQSSN
ncbi:uncharacterized protein LOC119767297 [Culex quinquefasciatus]|uniref:uncharacterized protein LOC119767297 n=1 Tax=Culex quinquefasciatus TaxID=7176 RepID=UPI0018E34D6A|nr:uncharacterized protein LOC119767297 [Culex quinquefasciatus]